MNLSSLRSLNQIERPTSWSKALLPTAHGPRQLVKLRCSLFLSRRRSHSCWYISTLTGARPFSLQPQQQLPCALEHTNKFPCNWTIRKTSSRADTLTVLIGLALRTTLSVISTIFIISPFAQDYNLYLALYYTVLPYGNIGIVQSISMKVKK